MNLYNLHSKPESLDHFEKVTANNPEVFWEKYKKNKEELKKREKYIAKSPKFAYQYATDILKRPFPTGEEAIAKSAEFSFYYAEDVLQGPFKLGEDVISKNAEFSFYYAEDVLQGPFKLVEEAISKDADSAKQYAKRVLKKDFYFNGKLIVEYTQ